MKVATKEKIAGGIILLVGVAVLLGVFGYKTFYGEIFGYERGTYNSPDGRYRVVIRARGINWLPGASGDAGGVAANVSIVDQKSGKRIAREPIEMAFWLGQVIASFGRPQM
jgi:hypothetical protein